MLILVIYQDNKMRMVDDFQLDDLIASNRIKRFLRSEGWVTINDGPIRRTSNNYKGRERRRHIKIKAKTSLSVITTGKVRPFESLF